jgi:hypothetical protein
MWLVQGSTGTDVKWRVVLKVAANTGYRCKMARVILHVLIKPSPFASLTIRMIWNRETEAEARVGPGRPAAQKKLTRPPRALRGGARRSANRLFWYYERIGLCYYIGLGKKFFLHAFLTAFEAAFRIT